MVENRQILIGDVLEQLAKIPDAVVDTTVTSPPYWGLRDYGVEGQWGLEPDFQDYLRKMNKFMKELKRVTKDTGSIWINLGDTYGGGVPHQDWNGTDSEFQGEENKEKKRFKSDFMKPYAKSRMGIPERFYINCIDRGFKARNHIPWIKENSMPSSVKDRFTNKWESVFFFVLQEKYYFNLDAVRVKPISEARKVKKKKEKTRNQKLFGGNETEEEEWTSKDSEVPSRNKNTYATLNDPDRVEQIREKYLAVGKNPGDVIYDNSRPYAVQEREGTVYFRELPQHEELRKYLTKWRKKSGITIDELEEKLKSQAPHHWFEKNGSYPTVQDWKVLKELFQFDSQYDEQMLTEFSKPAEKANHPSGKNPGDIFETDTRKMAQVDSNLTTPNKISLNSRIWDDISHPAGKNPGDVFEGQEGKWQRHFDENGNCYGCGLSWKKHKVSEKLKANVTGIADRMEAYTWCNPSGKNPGDVFKINPRPFPEAHFATFPIDLPLLILKASCPNQVCKKCGEPRFPISKPTEEYKKLLGKGWHDHKDDLGEGMSQEKVLPTAVASYEIVDWTKCNCNAGFQPGLVLDPFLGAGTTALAAEQLGLNWIGIELKEEYVDDIIRKRLDKHKNFRMTEFT